MSNVITETTTRSCPICQMARNTPRRTIDGWVLATCDSCGFLFAPTIRQNTATEFDLPDDYQPVSRARHAQVHRLLVRLLRPGATIVDVGAGFGGLGLVAHSETRFRYVGFEPSASVTAAARRRGVDLRAELFGQDTMAEPVDAVVLDNVIEPVADPVGLLRDCRSCLAPAGVLVVIVPNRRDIRQVVPNWRDANHWIPPEHINFFTARSLKVALEDLGLSVRPFGFAALDMHDWRYWPRAALEQIGCFPFGLNMYGTLPR